MNKVDLHIHSCHSDGSMSVEEIFAEGKQEGLVRLCITDHDSLPPWEEITAARDKYAIDTLTGVELSCQDPKTGRSVHLLGYGFRPDAPHIRAFCEQIGIRRRAQNARQLAKLRELGYRLEGEKLFAYTGPCGVLQKQHIFRLLMEAGYADALYSGLYFELFGPAGVLRDADESPSYEEGIHAILADGGLASLAHPGLEKTWDLLPELKRLGLGAVEVRHPVHSDADTAATAQLAGEYGLHATGGSDSHGEYSFRRRRLGECSSAWLGGGPPSERMFFARRILEKASALAAGLSQKPLSCRDKGSWDWVSEVDLAVQECIVSSIRAAYPGETIISEEMGGAEAGEGYNWILDPIDGTRNLLYERENFFISLALCKGSEPVLAVLSEPQKSDLFLGEAGRGVRRNGLPLPQLRALPLPECILENGTRRNLPAALLEGVQAIRYSGSIAKSMSLLLSGKRHLFLSDKARLWDYAGGKILLEELGGAVRVFPGKGRGGADFVAAALSPELLAELLAALGLEE